MQDNITIIIPILNEEENIGLLIDEIFKEYWNINILIIDDFSNDNWVKIVRDKINEYWNNLKIYVKDNKKYKWLTSSIILGIENIKTDYFIVMDWDFQHPIENIKNFIEFFKQWKNLVIWERKKIVFDEKKYRVLISKLWNFLINLKIRKNWFKLRDPLTWFFWWEKQFFIKIIDNNKNIFIWTWYKFLFEFLKIIKKDKIKLWKFYFNFDKRKFWKSKINSNIHIDFIKWLFKK